MKRILFLAFLFTAQSIYAQQMVTLQEVIQDALLKNYDILLVRNDSVAAAIDYDYKLAFFLPRLNGSASKLWNNNDQKQNFSDGTKRERNGIKSSNLQAAVNLNWTLFDGLRMFATRDKYEEFTKLGALNVRTQVVNTLADIINNYYNIVQQKQQLKAIEEQMSISEERVKLADRKLSVGLGSKPELLQAKVDLNAFKAAQLRQLTLISQLKEQLNQLTGRPLTDSYEVSDSIPINLDLSYSEVVKNLENTNPQLQVAKKNIDISKITLRENRADLWPTIQFNSAYNFSRTDNKAVVNPFTPLFSQNNGYNYGFSAIVPIFNGSNTRRLIRQAQLDVQYNELNLANVQSQVNLGLSNQFKNYDYQKKALTLEEENIELAKENVNIALARFRQGVSTFLELREAQISLADAYNRLISARYNTKLAEVELLRLKGELIR
jgi:outer membrane protein